MKVEVEKQLSSRKRGLNAIKENEQPERSDSG